jgi:hypothetical protein
MYTYFVALNDFGIRPWALFGMAVLKAPLPHDTDVYDAHKVVYDDFGKVVNMHGNTNIHGVDKVILGWDLIRNGKIDLRLFYAADRNDSAWTSCRWAPDDESVPRFMRISNITEKPICYSTEALKYA